MATRSPRNRAPASARRVPTTLARESGAASDADSLRPLPAPDEARALVTTTPPAPPRDAHGFDPAAYDWVPVPRAPRLDGWTPERQRDFIGHLADTGSVRTAADRTGMGTSSAYQLRRAPEGQAFALAWDAAIQQAASTLVDAAFERAVNGSEEPVFNREGQVVGRRFRQSDAMMMFLLRKHFPDRYGDLNRDRAAPAVATAAARPPAVAETLARLGPVRPADPSATMTPEAFARAAARADAGETPRALLHPDDAATQGLSDEMEALLQDAKQAAARKDRGCRSETYELD